MSTFYNEIKYAIRQLLKNPGFTTVAVLTLALGIGANLGLFGMLNELLLRPRPVANPDELWEIEPADTEGQKLYVNVCRPYYEAMREQRRRFKGLIGYAGIQPKLRMVEGVERVYAELVSGDYFDFLGVTPVLGRVFVPEEDAGMGTHSVAVISEAFWHSQFGGARDVIGKTLTLNDNVVEIIGVAPASFGGLGVARPSLWMPTSMESLLDEFTRYSIVCRLDDRKRSAASAAVLSPMAAAVTKTLSGFEDPRWARYGYVPNFQGVRLEPIGRGLLGVIANGQRVLGFLRFAGVATVLLLLIACANCAGLFLARALQRRKEMATRRALGATRAVLIRQLVGEGLLISMLSTVGALLVFSWLSAVVARLASVWYGPTVTPVLDGRVFLFATGTALVVGVVFSLIPALQLTRFQLFSALRNTDGSDVSNVKRSGLRHGLVVGQIVGSLMLLCGATLCLRGMHRQLNVDVGFQTERLAIAPLNLERVGFDAQNAVAQLARIARQVALIPGVKQVGISQSEPFDGRRQTMAVPRPEGYQDSDSDFIVINFTDVGPGTFAALGIPVLQGREIDHSDLELERDVALVNETFVRTFWPDQVVLGQRIRDMEVIGVVKDACFARFDEAPEPMVFRNSAPAALLNAKLLIQTAGRSARSVAAIRTQLAGIHPRLVQGDVITLENIMKQALGVQLTAVRLLSVVGGLALALAVIGTYGLVAYLVTQRTREIGIRLALGATRGDIVRSVLHVGLRLSIAAVLVGLPVALALAGLLRHRLEGISPFDPVAFAIVTAIILTSSILACGLPALRASRVAPMEALRYE